MRVEKIKRDRALVELSASELETLSNALNEVCHGLDVPDFSMRMGAEKPEVLKLLHRIGEALQSMNR